MKFDVKLTDVKRNNVGLETEFVIESNPKMFRILSDSMYKNKRGSIVREVSCNAYDSHTAAGWPERPFDIHVPDELEPYLSIRDYGVGLDDDGIRNTFTRYGKSTKEDDASQIGAFGLGSKTPFAYTDAFTIMAIKDGVKRQYSAFVNEKGTPAVALMDERVTDEENGVEIQIPVVDARDFQHFVNEIREQLTFFTVKPNISNYGDITYRNFTVGESDLLDIKNISIGSHNSSLRGIWAVQGVVGYQVDVALIKQHLTPENVAFLDILGRSALIRFDLGELEVVATREGISYTKPTFAAFNKKFDEGREAIGATVTDTFAAFPDAWAGAVKVNESEALSRLAKVTQTRIDSPYYYATSGGYFLDFVRVGNLAVVPEIGKPTTVIAGDDEDEDEEDDTASNDALLNSGLIFSAWTADYVRREYRWRDNGASKGVKASPRVKLVFRDTTDKPVIRMREFTAACQRNDWVFVVQNRDGSIVTPAQKAAILDRIGGSFAAITDMSAIDLPPPEQRVNAGYKPPTAYTYTAGCDTHTTRFWQRESLKLKEWTEGGYYVIVDRHSVSIPSESEPVLKMAEANMLDRPVVAIRQKDADKMDKTIWTPLAEKVKEVRESILSNKTLQNSHILLSKNVQLFSFLDYGVRTALKEAVDAGKINNRSALNKVFRVESTIAKLKQRAQSRGYNSIAASVFETSCDTDTTKFDSVIEKTVQAIEGEVHGAYPMLASVRASYITNTAGEHVRALTPAMADHVVQYINMFDTANAGA